MGVGGPLGNFVNMLGTWEFSFPHLTHWAVVFERFPSAVQNDIIKQYEPLIDQTTSFQFSNEYGILLANDKQKLCGCIYAYKFNTPSESSQLNVSNNTSYGGITGLPYIDARKIGGQNSTIKLTFIENTLSFVDTVIRPWSILTSYKGLVARLPDDEITTNIYVYEFGPRDINENVSIRKMWTFTKCAPITVPGTVLTYERNNTIETVETEWVFAYYNIHTPIKPVTINA